MRTLPASVFASVAVLSFASVAAQSQGSLAGRLTAADSPLSYCTISLYRLDASENRYVENIVTRTADNGSYRFDSLVPSTYILLGTCGDKRVYQGKLVVRSGANVHDVSLSDPFSGKWKLDPKKSRMGQFAGVRDELREYRRTGSTTTMSWQRIDQAGRRTQGSYKLVCDGVEYAVSGQQMTCRFVDSDTVEGYQKPPISYYVRKVSGDTLTIFSYSDPSHKQLMSTLVFNRVP